MTICYFYSKVFEAAKQALPEYATTLWTGNDPWSYFWALASCWNLGKELITIEQDVVINPQVLKEFEACESLYSPEHQWCIFRYRSGPEPYYPLIERGLGCTRFSELVQATVSIDDILSVSCDLRKQCAEGVRSDGIACRPSALCWRHIDGPVSQALMKYGWNSHIHHPVVDHVHDW